jgi:hypothetical protein
MSGSREPDSARPEAELPPEVVREIRGLKAVNKILVEKVIELEDVVAKLKRGEREELQNVREESASRLHRREADRFRQEEVVIDEPEEDIPIMPEEVGQRLQPRRSLIVDVEPARPESANEPLFLESTVPKATTSSGPAPEITTTPLPEYSPLLPPIDRTKAGEEFYADLQDKRIIPGYDEDRFSCWCHVAKEQSGKVAPSENLSNAHSDVASVQGASVKRYKTFRWFAHAKRCAFYSVSLPLRCVAVADAITGSLGDNRTQRNGRATIPAVSVAETFGHMQRICGFTLARRCPIFRIFRTAATKQEENLSDCRACSRLGRRK